MPAAGEPHSIVLVAVPKSRLADRHAPLDLTHQPPHVAAELVVEGGAEPGHHRPQQEPADARGRVDRKVAVTERDASGGRDGTGMPDLQLSENHLSRSVAIR